MMLFESPASRPCTPAPSIVLLLPVIIPLPVLAPIAVLAPIELFKIFRSLSAFTPTAALLFPKVFE